ncbi:MAG TPA: hypothetical protein VGN05_08605 [Parvibaculum sp.]|jgi:hypothetical protein
MANKARISTSLKRTPRSLKHAVANLIAEFPSVEQASRFCRAQASSLSGYANPNQMERIVPVDVVLDLERKLGRPVVTEFVAARLGYSLVPLPKVRDSDPLGQRIRRIVKEGSKVFVDAADALEDGEITTDEAVILVAAVERAIFAFVDLSTGLDEIIASSKPYRVGLKSAVKA